MNCTGVRDLLSAYLDGELSAGELLRVEQHLRRCHDCAGEVESLRQTIDIVASMEEVEVPANFRAQLHERLVAIGPPAASRRMPTFGLWQRRIRTWGLPAAAAAAVLGLGLMTYARTGDQILPGLQVNQTASVERPASPVAEQPEVAPPVVVAKEKERATVAAAPPPAPETVAQERRATPQVAAVDPPAPVENRIPTTLSAYAVSYLDQVTPIEALPVKAAISYSFTARVEDPAAIARLLGQRYPATGNGVPMAGGSGLVSLITISGGQVADELAFIRSVIGPDLTEEPPVRSDRSASLQLAYGRLKDLDQQRAQRLRAMVGVTDESLLAVAKSELEELGRQAVEAQVNLQRVLAQVNEVSITVILQRDSL